jgi:hypothetical protein
MKNPATSTRAVSWVTALGLLGAAGWVGAQGLTWHTIANMSDLLPGTTASFNSFNQPSVNAAGLVVFRARSKGPNAIDGVYTRDMSPALRSMAVSAPIVPIVVRGAVVPQPNNTYYTGVLASFMEFPSIPRIDIASPMVATRGQSQPVYTYLLPDGVTETRVGTSGIYANPGGVPMTGASLLGAVSEKQGDGSFALTFAHYQVPGAPPGTRFDQFPGGPAVTDGSIIAWKGNYTDPTDGLGRTGIFYRDVTMMAGKAPTFMIASSNTLIPNQPAPGGVKFGSTAPPSAANGIVVFTGFDNEDSPTLGGIYASRLEQPPAIQTLVGIGTRVPGEPAGVGFTRFGEGLSITSDARFVSFWGAWGTEAIPRTLMCPTDGNVDLIAYCNSVYPSGYVVDIPVHQGIFVHDRLTGLTRAAAKTTQEGIVDFVYWVFSGAPPGVGDASQELPRWRSSAFSAISGTAGVKYQVAFKAKRSGVDGIYVRQGADMGNPLVSAVETFASAAGIDPAAPTNALVTSVGIERDGFRQGALAVTVSMLYETVDTSIGWAGLYLTTLASMPAAASPTVAVRRPSNSTFYVDINLDRKTEVKVPFGVPSDIPLAGRMDPGSTYDLVLYRNGLWYADVNRDGVAEYFAGFGGDPADLPLLADFTGDQRDDFVVYRNGVWYVDTDQDGTANKTFAFGGVPGDVPLAGDVNGDGIADLAIYRGGVWYFDTNRDGTADLVAIFGGAPPDKPLLVDWNGDGKADPVLMRDGVWYVNTKLDGTVQAWFMYGGAGDAPLAWIDPAL